ncbi:MAG: hypothetical protein K2K72_07000 [Duncaniella sp.]|nr:hypothetical protein [Duncaniella sp.]
MSTDEAAEEEVYEAVEQVSYDSAAPADGANMILRESTIMAGGAMVTEEASADAGNDADGGNSGAPEAPAAKPEPFAYREAVAPLAFFRPDLVTDSDGRLALKFTVPDANASWRLRLLALTDSLLSANFTGELTVSRRLMVQPNLPRFVRNGDTVVIPVNVMNSTDSTLTVTVGMECFDPASGSNVAEADRLIEIAANSSAVATLAVKVPEGATALGFRVKAIADDCSDGEQSLLTVLPSLTAVNEAVPFRLPTGGGNVSLKVPAQARDGRVSLQVCANPVWSVVTALPGLVNSEAITSTEAARAIFAASVASGLIKDNPEIARVLREWTARGAGSDELTSMLERNEDLKIMLLSATPWVTDAKDDTRRMRRLALLFDSKLIDKTLSDNIALLSQLSVAGGGWKWSPQSDEASGWATSQVLDLMGRLNELGFLPASPQLRDMITRALAWETALTLKQFNKYPDGNYSDYVWRHSLFTSLGIGAPDQRIVNATTGRILSDWRKAPLTVKALDARLLSKYGYPAVARSILESIREFAVSDQARGVWFPSLTDNSGAESMEVLSATAFILETFAQLDPADAVTDGIRQWLILGKSAQNWGNSAATTDMVAAVLTSSRRWIDSTTDAGIKVDGRRVPTADIDRVTGQWDAPLEARKVAGREVKVAVKSASPSWGALYCSYEAPGDSVKAQSCPELAVTRTLLAGAGPLAVGQRVTVLLTVKVNEDMDYVVIDDQRGACFEPVDQLPATVWLDGARAYRVSGDTATRFFIDRLRRGTYQLTYDVYVNNAGTYTSGIATAQSQYAPRFTAHSSGSTLNVK